MKPRTRPVPPEQKERQGADAAPMTETSNDQEDPKKGVELPATVTRERPRHSPNHEV